MFSTFHVYSAGTNYGNTCLHSCHSPVLPNGGITYKKKVTGISLLSVIGYTVQLLIC